MTAALIAEDKVRKNIFENLERLSNNVGKAYDIFDSAKVIDVTLSPALEYAKKLFGTYEEVFRLTVWQHTVKYSVNSAKVCLVLLWL